MSADIDMEGQYFSFDLQRKLIAGYADIAEGRFTQSRSDEIFRQVVHDLEARGIRIPE